MITCLGKKLNATGSCQRAETVDHLRAVLFKLIYGDTGNRETNFNIAPGTNMTQQHLVDGQIAFACDTPNDLPVQVIVEIAFVFPDVEKLQPLQSSWLVHLKIEHYLPPVVSFA